MGKQPYSIYSTCEHAGAILVYAIWRAHTDTISDKVIGGSVQGFVYRLEQSEIFFRGHKCCMWAQCWDVITVGTYEDSISTSRAQSKNMDIKGLLRKFIGVKAFGGKHRLRIGKGLSMLVRMAALDCLVFSPVPK